MHQRAYGAPLLAPRSGLTSLTPAKTESADFTGFRVTLLEPSVGGNHMGDSASLCLSLKGGRGEDGGRAWGGRGEGGGRAGGDL